MRYDIITELTLFFPSDDALHTMDRVMTLLPIGNEPQVSRRESLNFRPYEALPAYVFK